MYDKFSKVNLEPITYYENQDLNGTTLYLGKKAGNGIEGNAFRTFVTC